MGNPGDKQEDNAGSLEDLMLLNWMWMHKRKLDSSGVRKAQHGLCVFYTQGEKKIGTEYVHILGLILNRLRICCARVISLLDTC